MSHAETRALITGGSQGLGYAIAEALIAEGCPALVIASRDTDQGDAAARRLSALGAEVSFVPVEMAETDQVFSMVDTAAARLGRLNALVNCAADTGRGSVLDTTPEVWDRIMNVNARGAFFGMQRFAQQAIAAGHGGGIVNILSVVIHAGLPFLAPYGASKSALLHLTKNGANTLAPHRIRVNGINVGWMDTPGEDATQKACHGRADGWLAEAEANMPFGQLVKPQEVAAQASFFLSPRSGVVTGTTLDFDQQVVGAYPDTNDA